MKNKGFTLVEVLAVITILAFVLAIIVPQISKAVHEQSKKTFEVNVISLLRVIETDILENELIKPVTYNFNGYELVRKYKGTSTVVTYIGEIKGVSNATIIYKADGSIELENFTNGVFEATYNNGVLVE